MVTKPQLAEEPNFVNGLAAVALFVVLAALFAAATLGNPAGFGENPAITASLGYAMFDLTDQAATSAESFLVTFEVIDLVLVAALVGAVTLARREDKGSMVTAITDGGRDLIAPADGDDEPETDGGEQ